MKYQKNSLLILFMMLFSGALSGQSWSNKSELSRADTARGSVTPERAWWDVLKYEILIQPDYTSKTVRGENTIHFREQNKHHPAVLQIDLQAPLQIDSIRLDDTYPLKFRRESNAYYLEVPALPAAAKHQLHIYYHGSPHEAVMPPWDGGWVWASDSLGRPWMTVVCQGIGASVWYPCKDHLSDEPEEGAIVSVIVPDTLQAVANGRLKLKKKLQGSNTCYSWEISNPINSYNIIPYIGKYVNLKDGYAGEKGHLDIDYWIIDYNVARARPYMPQQVKQALKCFEHWFGPYPFYSDGYKLVDAPGYGMEHQSAIAYGNGYQFGHKGKDHSGSGWVMKWDFLIVHETAHEWFGNSISVSDIANKWVHEAFAAYSEVLLTTDLFGVAAGNSYVIGTRKMVRNNSDIIARYGINEEGGSDMYPKGRNMIHIIRQLINDDGKFRAILRSMNEKFYHKIVSSEEIERFWSAKTGIDLSKIFDQYLRTTQIPLLEYGLDSDQLKFRFSNCLEDFSMPVKIYCKQGRWIRPTTRWQQLVIDHCTKDGIKIDSNFYIESKPLSL